MKVAILRVAVYARVSTSDQSTDMQLHDLRGYSKARGWKVQGEYIDHGISGAKRERPQLGALMDGAKKRKFDCVLVWRFDRFARSTSHLLEALETFRGLGIDFVSFNENVDTTSPMGKCLFSILSAIAELERSIIRERVVAGIQRAKAKGTRFGRPLKIDRAKIRELLKTGLSMAAVAKKVGCSAGAVHYIANGS